MDNFVLDKKRLFYILGFLFLLFTLPIAILLVQRQQRYTGRAYSNDPPKSVHVTNVYSKGFTVSWVTNSDTIGKIKMCGTDINCGAWQPIQDVRGVTSATKTHFVNVTVNDPNVLYYFQILSGDTGVYGISPTTPEQEIYTDDQVVSSGASFKVTTLALLGNENDAANNPPGAYSKESGAFLPCPDGTETLPSAACFRPNPIFGEVIMPDGTTKASGTIIYMYVNSGTIVASKMLSALAESTSPYEGKWTMDMANFYKKEGTAYLGYTPGSDKLIISADGAPNLKVDQTEFGVPEVIDDSCITNVLNCAKAPTAPVGVNPVSLTLKSVAVPTPSSGVTPTIPPVSNKRDVSGDSSGVPDGKVNSQDAGYILGNPFPCGPAPYTACPVLSGKSRDVSGDSSGVPDGKVNSQDAGYILGNPFPCGLLPYPACP